MFLSLISLRSTRLVPVIAAVLLSAAFLGTGELLLRERRAALEAVTINQGNLTVGLERDIMRNIDLYDLSLRAAASGLRLVDPSMAVATQNAILFDGSSAARYFLPILIADASGTVVRDAGSAKPRLASVSDRPFFEAHRHEQATGLLVSLMMRGKISGKPYLSLSRRVSGPDGSFNGTVSGGFDLRYFEEILSHFSLPDGGAVALVGLDGRFVAGFPNHGDMVGRDLRGSGLVERARLDDSATFVARSIVYGKARVATIRRLGNLPFFLVAGTPVDVVYAQWTQRAWAVGASLIAFAATATALLMALFRELGRRRLAERVAVEAYDASQASERRLLTYVDQLADGLLAIRRDAAGGFVYERVNAAAASMLDIRPEDAIGRHPREVWPAPVAALVEGRYARCLATDGTIHYEHQVQGPDRARVLRFALAPIREVPGGPVTLLLESLRDVTDAVEMEAKLRQAQRMEAVGQLTAGVAHDFNNMLQAQLGALHILMKQSQEMPLVRKYAEMALAAGERGSALTQSLLSFSRKQNLAPLAVPVADLLARLESMLRRTLGPRIELRVRGEHGSAAPFADLAQLESALLNLALNARDAMPDGGAIEIEARAGGAEMGGPGWLTAGGFLFAVSDTGVGMAADVAAKACEPFFTTKEVGKGSGLGLSMVQGFVQQSGGSMHIASAPGHGTRVELWLPLAETSLARVEEEGPEHPAPGNLASGRAISRVLLVDDDPDVLAITAMLLEDSGFEVVQAAYGSIALSLLERDGLFDMLVTDYMMPGMDGAELVRRATQLRPTLPMLIITGYAESEVLRGLPAHVELAFKPIGGGALLERVATTLGRADGRPPSAVAVAA